MKNFKKAIAVAALGLGLGMAGQASATDFTVPLTFGGGVYTGGFSDTGVTGNFTDSFTFNLPKLGAGSSFTLSSSSVTASSVITGLAGYLDTPSQAFTVTQSGTSPYTFDFGTLLVPSLTAGNHTLYITGNTGTASISGTITVAVAAVPEPATWAMMIGGVGFTGGALRRRAKRDAGKLALA
jgi:hypothetical protein